jgi:sugar-specific transcriptional regulator TrmB
MDKYILAVLKDFGLTENESEVYIYLSKSCMQKAGTISKRLNMHKAQVYRILNNLRRKGLVESTFEAPMRFEAVHFKSFLDLMIKTKREEIDLLEENKEELFAHWNSITCVDCPVFRSGRFMIIEGRNNLYSMFFQIIEKAKIEVLAVTEALGLIQTVRMGLFDVLEKNKTKFRFLTTITKDNLRKIKPILERLTTINSNFTVNHVDWVSGIFPHFIIRDNDEAIIFLAPEKESLMDKKNETGIWTDKPAVFYVKSFFETLWQKSTNIKKRILEIETEIV